MDDRERRNVTTSSWEVSIETAGQREGAIEYREPGGTIAGSWEFGGATDVLAQVTVSPFQDWDTRFPWAAGRRDEIVKRIADEVVRQRAPGCWADIHPASNIILIRRSGRQAGQ